MKYFHASREKIYSKPTLLQNGRNSFFSISTRSNLGELLSRQLANGAFGKQILNKEMEKTCYIGNSPIQIETIFQAVVGEDFHTYSLDIYMPTKLEEVKENVLTIFPSP